MFIDSFAPGNPGGEPCVPLCRSCKGAIGPDEKSAQISFAAHDDAELQGLNGFYHRQCAVPILSVKRVYDMLRGLAGP